jgi:hypothetical protein
VINCQFSFAKVRYKGLAKNTSQLMLHFALCAEQCADGAKTFGCVRGNMFMGSACKFPPEA